MSCINKKNLQKQNLFDISFLLQFHEHSQQDHAKTPILNMTNKVFLGVNFYTLKTLTLRMIVYLGPGMIHTGENPTHISGVHVKCILERIH